MYCSDCEKRTLRGHKKVCTSEYIHKHENGIHCVVIDCGRGFAKHHYLTETSGERLNLATYGTYLRHLPREAAVGILIDSFRMRERDKLFSGEERGGHAVDKFRAYLDLMESREGMAPSWWNSRARSACMTRATQKKDNGRWYIGTPLTQVNVLLLYRDYDMPRKLRLFAAKVYGWGLKGMTVGELY